MEPATTMEIPAPPTNVPPSCPLCGYLLRAMFSPATGRWFVAAVAPNSTAVFWVHDCENTTGPAWKHTRAAGMTPETRAKWVSTARSRIAGVGTPNNTGGRSTTGVVGAEQMRKLRGERRYTGRLQQPLVLAIRDQDSAITVGTGDHDGLVRVVHGIDDFTQVLACLYEAHPAHISHPLTVHVRSSSSKSGSVPFSNMCNINTRPATGRRTHTALTGGRCDR